MFPLEKDQDAGSALRERELPMNRCPMLKSALCTNCSLPGSQLLMRSACYEKQRALIAMFEIGVQRKKNHKLK